jgi:guanylate kinase
VIERRLKGARREIAHWREYDYLIVNDRLPEAAAALKAVVEAARRRRSVQEGIALKICGTFGGS